MRPADRGRVLELTADVWDGHDYVGQVFDEWVGDPGAWFEAAEVDGFVVGLHRLRPLNRRIVWYEALRVDSQHRHRGIGAAMVREAAAAAARMGYEEMRLASGGASPFFARIGCQPLVELGSLAGGRIEGGEPARIPPMSEAPRLYEGLRADPAYAAYNGLNADFGGALDLDMDEFEARLEAGFVRVTAGGRALAIVRASSGGSRLRVTFLSGSGAALDELLLALRFEADADGRSGVSVLLPPSHPALGTLEAAGFEPQNWDNGGLMRFTIFARRLGED